MIKIEKFKQIIIFIIKSAIFLGLASVFHALAFVLSVTTPFFLYKTLKLPEDFITQFGIECLNTYFCVVLVYFSAKKLDIIKVFDKSPLLIVILILVVYEIVLFLMPYNIDNEHLNNYLFNSYYAMITTSHLDLDELKYGEGCAYVFVVCFALRFLVNKYPKLSWLKKFYPQKLETIITFKNFKKYTYDAIKKLLIGKQNEQE